MVLVILLLVTTPILIFLKFLSSSDLDEIVEKCESFESRIEDFATKAHCFDEVEASADETDEKVRDMRDEYIGGEWEEADEVLEWTGFYTGAALVHWHLIQGAAEAMDHMSLRELATDAIDFYNGLFVKDEDILHTIGEKAVGSEHEEDDGEDLGE